MPLFVCSKCEHVDNTALGNYWIAEMEKTPKLCCACDPEINSWHRCFDRIYWRDYLRQYPKELLLNRPDGVEA